MKSFIWLLKWVLNAAIFFALFAFALNNQHDVIVHFFLGRQWHAPLVVVVLITFALGVLLGALAMMPHWWRQRRTRDAIEPASGGASSSVTSATVAPSDGH